MNDIIEISKQYGINCHSETNHLYDNKPYQLHLEMVYCIAESYIDCIPEKDRNNVLAACWTHDVIEDCRQTYNDVKNATNKEVANLTYALTNEKGMTRKGRANAKYYQGIRLTKHAAFLKCCDRIANIIYSKRQGSTMFNKYVQENKEFMSELYSKEYDKVFEHLLIICEQ